MYPYDDDKFSNKTRLDTQQAAMQWFDEKISDNANRLRKRKPIVSLLAYQYELKKDENRKLRYSQNTLINRLKKQVAQLTEQYKANQIRSLQIHQQLQTKSSAAIQKMAFDHKAIYDNLKTTNFQLQRRIYSLIEQLQSQKTKSASFHSHAQLKTNQIVKQLTTEHKVVTDGLKSTNSEIQGKLFGLLSQLETLEAKNKRQQLIINKNRVTQQDLQKHWSIEQQALQSRIINMQYQNMTLQQANKSLNDSFLSILQQLKQKDQNNKQYFQYSNRVYRQLAQEKNQLTIILNKKSQQYMSYMEQKAMKERQLLEKIKAQQEASLNDRVFFTKLIQENARVTQQNEQRLREKDNKIKEFILLNQKNDQKIKEYQAQLNQKQEQYDNKISSFALLIEDKQKKYVEELAEKNKQIDIEKAVIASQQKQLAKKDQSLTSLTQSFDRLKENQLYERKQWETRQEAQKEKEKAISREILAQTKSFYNQRLKQLSKELQLTKSNAQKVALSKEKQISNYRSQLQIKNSILESTRAFYSKSMQQMSEKQKLLADGLVSKEKQYVQVIQDNTELMKKAAYLESQNQDLQQNLSSLESNNLAQKGKIDELYKQNLKITTSLSQYKSDAFDQRLKVFALERKLHQMVSNLSKQKQFFQNQVKKEQQVKGKILQSNKQVAKKLQDHNQYIFNQTRQITNLQAQIAQQKRINQSLNTSVTRLKQSKKALEDALLVQRSQLSESNQTKRSLENRLHQLKTQIDDNFHQYTNKLNVHKVETKAQQQKYKAQITKLQQKLSMETSKMNKQIAHLQQNVMIKGARSQQQQQIYNELQERYNSLSIDLQDILRQKAQLQDSFSHQQQKMHSMELIVQKLQTAQLKHLQAMNLIKNQQRSRSQTTHITLSTLEIKKQKLQAYNSLITAENDQLRKQLQFFRHKTNQLQANIIMTKFISDTRLNFHKNKNEVGRMGNYIITLTEKSPTNIYIGIQVQNQDQHYYTHQFIVGTPENTLKPLISLDIDQYLASPQTIIIPFGYINDSSHKEGKYGKGFQPGIIIDKYRGKTYIGVRMLNYQNGSLKSTRIGFNLTVSQYKQMRRIITFKYQTKYGFFQ